MSGILTVVGTPLGNLGDMSPRAVAVSYTHLDVYKRQALYCGFEKAQGDVVITMDADLQDSPDEIPELYRMITEDGIRDGIS